MKESNINIGKITWPVLLFLSLLFVLFINNKVKGKKEQLDSIVTTISTKPKYTNPGRGDANIIIGVSSHNKPVYLKGVELELFNVNELMQSVDVGDSIFLRYKVGTKFINPYELSIKNKSIQFSLDQYLSVKSEDREIVLYVWLAFLFFYIVKYFFLPLNRRFL